MWNLTPDYIQQVKEELKGRRAAIEARYADELKSIASDLEDIETLERIAYAFAVKHLPDPVEADEAEAKADPEPEMMAELKPSPVEPEAAKPAPEPKGLSRWRARLDANSESEPA